MAVNRLRNALGTARKGETFELRSGLVSQYAWERKESIQKTIMSMTLGKDVSALFPDVLKNIATPDLDQKKLVYLYLMNYAKSHPDLCILAVNTFVQDTEDPNPLVRALAIRTMGCIRVDKMVDYMEEPLRKTLKDESPYVRKTAALCVAKLFDLNPSLCIENGFLETLQEMVGDSNPMVVANSVTALAEINETSPETQALVVTPQTLKKMLLALNECTEWGRITLLTTLADYKTSDVKESEHICERVSPQFQHVNPAVVLAAVKAVFLHMQNINNPTLHATYLKKMSPPLVTLVSSQPEVQYVALRNIDLLLQKQPGILDKEMRVFFCKYNDPPYLKLQKLEIMVRIANSSNVDQLLAELKEYAMEVDMDFVRKAVRAIGQVAIKIEECAEKAVNVLLELINSKVGYVVQEVIVVIKDIFRRYPGYEGIIPTLCQCIDDLDEPNARGSLIWIVGEYAEKISNAEEILAGFVDGFNEEFTQVSSHKFPFSTIKFTDNYHHRPSSKSSQPSSNSTSKTPQPRNPSFKRSSNPPPPNPTTPTSATAPTSTGACSPPTHKPRATSSSPNVPKSPAPSPSSPDRSSTPSSRTSPPSPPSTTNHPKPSSAKAAPRPSKPPPSKRPNKTPARTPSPPKPSPPPSQAAPRRRKITWRISSTSTLTARRPLLRQRQRRREP
jgi:vesicle coat complex subunit